MPTKRKRSRPQAAIKQKTGMGAVACAAASGDVTWRDSRCTGRFFQTLDGCSLWLQMPKAGPIHIYFRLQSKSSVNTCSTGGDIVPPSSQQKEQHSDVKG